jgi:muconate cycloisomerase
MTSVSTIAVGFGEGTTIGGLAYGAECPESMKLAIDTYFSPHLLQGNPNRIGALMTTIGKAVRGNHFAKCAVETALLDAFGKRNGLSVADLLGGRVRDRLPVAWTLASGDTARDTPKPRKCCRAVGTMSSAENRAP